MIYISNVVFGIAIYNHKNFTDPNIKKYTSDKSDHDGIKVIYYVNIFIFLQTLNRTEMMYLKMFLDAKEYSLVLSVEAGGMWVRYEI